MHKGYGYMANSPGTSEAWLLITLTLIAAFTTAKAACGGYLKLTTTSGHIQSPNYPNNYAGGTHCIWLLQAPAAYVISLTVSPVKGEADSSGECIDYVEIRNGSGTSPILFRECLSQSTTTLRSLSRWVWVRFKTDYDVSNTGFKVNWTTEKPDSSGIAVSPIPECQPVKFRCANKECISVAYVCDSYNDCGCDGYSCDENNCGGFGWSQTTRVVVGVAIGSVVFMLVFFGVGYLEIFLKRRAENEYRKQMDDAKKRARLHRNKPTTGDAKVVPTSDGVMLDVPPVKTPSTPGSVVSLAQTPRST